MIKTQNLRHSKQTVENDKATELEALKADSGKWCRHRTWGTQSRHRKMIKTQNLRHSKQTAENDEDTNLNNLKQTAENDEYVELESLKADSGKWWRHRTSSTESRQQKMIKTQNFKHGKQTKENDEEEKESAAEEQAERERKNNNTFLSHLCPRSCPWQSAGSQRGWWRSWPRSGTTTLSWSSAATSCWRWPPLPLPARPHPPPATSDPRMAAARPGTAAHELRPHLRSSAAWPEELPLWQMCRLGSGGNTRVREREKKDKKITVWMSYFFVL